MPFSQDISNTIVSHKAYSLGQPVDEAFDHVRSIAGIDKAQPDGYDPFWVIGRHEDVMAVELQPELFHTSDRSSVLTTTDGDKFTRALTGEANMVRSLVAVDGEEHKALRAIAFPAFTPRKIAELETLVRGIAVEFVERMIDMGPECDFAEDVAFLYPLRVVMQVLGVPKEDEPFMLKLTQETFSSNDPDLNRDGKVVTPTEALMTFSKTMVDLETYFAKVTADLRANPQDNINSVIANAKINGEYLNHRQLMGYYIIAATAGHDTTSNTAAAALWALAERPELYAQLRADPSLLNNFVEELIRWAVPVKHFMRTATADTELFGSKVAKGDWLMLSYHSANRDDRVFDNPYTFDINRKPNKHVSFGYGPHVCLGQHLARFEMRILWEELLKRVKTVELAGEPLRTQSNFVCGPKKVPVRFTVN